MAGKHDIIIEQGADFALDLVVKDSGVVRNLTGYLARAEMRVSKSTATVAATFDGTIPSPTLGTIRITLANSVTKDLTPGIYYYDIEVYTSSDAAVDRILEGRVTVTANITKP